MTETLAQLSARVPRNRQPYESVLETIGWTPLIRLTRVTRGLRTPVYGKAEFFNPGGSVKDRIGLPIIEKAEREGTLRPGGVIVEGTSGNTGVGLAIAAALKGYRCIFTMPDKMSQEKVRLLKAFGAEVIITPTAVPPDHPDNYVMMAKRIAAETPNAVLANQFYNEANPAAHEASTGPELWEQTEGRITHFVAAAGTGGTLTGVGRYLKAMNPKIQIDRGRSAGVDPRRVLAQPRREQGGRGALQGRRDRAGQASGDARHERDRRIPDGERQGCVRDGAAPDAGGGALRRRLGGADRARGAQRGAPGRTIPSALVVTFLCDTGRAVPLEAVQRRVDAREPAPRGGSRDASRR